MAFGRETRFPFLDYDLVTGASTCRPGVRPQRMQKWILRRPVTGCAARDPVAGDKWVRALACVLRGPSETGHMTGSSPALVTPRYDRAALSALWTVTAREAMSPGRSGAGSAREWLALLRDGSWKAEGPHDPESDASERAEGGA